MTRMEWVEKVDAICWEVFGISHDCLEDYTWESDFSGGCTPEETVANFRDYYPEYYRY